MAKKKIFTAEEIKLGRDLRRVRNSLTNLIDSMGIPEEELIVKRPLSANNNRRSGKAAAAEPAPVIKPRATKITKK